MRRRLPATAACLALFGVVACSGTDGESAGPNAGSDPAPVESTTDTEAIADPDLDGPIETSTPVASGSAASATSADDFCDAIDAIRAADFELEDTFGEEARALFADVSSSAPPAIADEVATVVDTLDAVAEIGISEDEDDPAAVEAAFEILLDPAYLEANDQLVAFTSDTCGIDLADGDDVDLDGLDLEEFDAEVDDDEDRSVGDDG